MSTDTHLTQKPFQNLSEKAADTFDSTQIAQALDFDPAQIEQQIQEFATAAKTVTTEFIQKKPVYALLGAAGFGLVVGAFLARRR